jgi:hypothetical protein
VGSPPRPHATIAVASLPPLSGQKGAAAAAAASKVVPEPCVLLASRAQEATADLLLQLEYTAGACVLTSDAGVPVQALTL